MYKLRGIDLGEDRFYRKYWALPHCGGVWVESYESAGCSQLDDNKPLLEQDDNERVELKRYELERVKEECKKEIEEANKENITNDVDIKDVKNELKMELKNENKTDEASQMPDKKMDVDFVKSLSNGDICEDLNGMIAMDTDICDVSPLKALKRRENLQLINSHDKDGKKEGEQQGNEQNSEESVQNISETKASCDLNKNIDILTQTANSIAELPIVTSELPTKVDNSDVNIDSSTEKQSSTDLSEVAKNLGIPDVATAAETDPNYGSGSSKPVSAEQMLRDFSARVASSQMGWFSIIPRKSCKPTEMPREAEFKPISPSPFGNDYSSNCSSPSFSLVNRTSGSCTPVTSQVYCDKLMSDLQYSKPQALPKGNNVYIFLWIFHLGMSFLPFLLLIF